MLLFIFTILLILILIFALATLIPLFAGLMRGAPYVPSNRKKMDIMLDFADVQPGEKVIDLGSGDGRAVIAMAQAGAEAYGYEINPWLVLWSRYLIKRAGVQNNAKIYWRNFWKDSFRDYDAVILYLLPGTMIRLEEKLKNEAKPGCRIVSNAFIFPNTEPLKSDDRVYLYSFNT